MDVYRIVANDDSKSSSHVEEDGGAVVVVEVDGPNSTSDGNTGAVDTVRIVIESDDSIAPSATVEGGDEREPISSVLEEGLGETTLYRCTSSTLGRDGACRRLCSSVVRRILSNAARYLPL